MSVEFAKKIASTIDISCVRTNVSIQEIDSMVEAVKKYHFIAAFAMPCYTKYLIDSLAGCDDVMVGGVVGFPSGAETLPIKILQVKELKEIGVNEIDSVINVGMLLSGNDENVLDELREIVQEAWPIPVKAIIEACFLTDEEIIRVSQIVMESGAAYIKTGTGWGPKPTTIDTIKLIKSVVKDTLLIKAAGGIRDLDTIEKMIEAGCSRFGVSTQAALSIMEQIETR